MAVRGCVRGGPSDPHTPYLGIVPDRHEGAGGLLLQRLGHVRCGSVWQGWRGLAGDNGGGVPTITDLRVRLLQAGLHNSALEV